jgi:hypothetical protein
VYFLVILTIPLITIRHRIVIKEVDRMPIVFVDERISIFANDNTGALVLTATPLLIGDIGLQTFTVANTAIAANVRIALDGTVKVTGDVELFATLTLTIERNSTGIAGTGVLIYTQIFETDGFESIPPLSITAGDFPPAAAVNAGQIRYTLFIASTGAVTLTGPVGFNGSAAAGTNP